MYEMEGFAKRLHDLRKGKSFTQEEFAARLGVTPQAVSKWENGQSYPDITLFPAIAGVLETSIDSLYGKIEEERAYGFPPVAEGMPLVHSYGDTACYSDKTVASAEGSGVRFTDGSTAELNTGLAVNTGKGEIRFITGKETFPIQTQTSKAADYEFPGGNSLDIEINAGICGIKRSRDDKTRVTIRGDERFIRHHRVMHIEGTLSIRCDDPDALRELDHTQNKVQIELPCERGQRARLLLNGKGELSLTIDFAVGELHINGSGDIRAASFGRCGGNINGSGLLRLGDAEETDIGINGSGDVEIQNAGKLSVKINGSGDCQARSARIFSAQINGSGDVTVDELQGGDVSLRINGSGDVAVKRGSCQSFDARLMGAGDVDASGLTARKANIVIEHAGSVVLGRVLEGSSERTKKGTIRILRRGAEEA